MIRIHTNSYVFASLRSLVYLYLYCMKTDIHPTYFLKAKVHCACGNAFEVGSTKEKIEVEICSACHPFYTGEEKVLDTAGRVEKFKAKRAVAEAKQIKLKEIAAKRKVKNEKKQEDKKEKTAR